MTTVNRASNGNSNSAGDGGRHLIRADETLSSISERYGVSVAELLAANRQIKDPNRIYAGQTLVIPSSQGARKGATGATPERHTDGDTRSAIASRQGIDLGRMVKANLQARNSGETRVEQTGGTLAPSEATLRARRGDDPNAILSRFNPSGASDATAKQDGLPRRGIHGVAASRAMAETDSDCVMRYRERFEEAGRRYDLPPALLAAIASRESRGGAALDRNGEGDNGHGFGLMQVDNRNPFRVVREGGPFGQQHINQAASILRDKLDTVRRQFPNMSPEQQLQTAVSRYNGGAGRPYPNSDRGTTGADYSNDVLARAQHYANTENWNGGGNTNNTGGVRETERTAPATRSPWTPAPSLADVRAGRAVLEQGQQGRAVTELQRMLDIPADGKFGAQTDRAVRDYQREHDLKVDGLVGRRTLGSLERTGGTERTETPPRTGGTGRVSYNGNHVTDPAVRAKLQEIADFFGRRVVVTSGDRHHIVNGNRRSHHLHGRAADFHVEGMSDGEAFRQLRESGILARDYQVIHHTEVTTSPHLHIGHWGDNRRSDFIVDTGQILPRRR